MHDEKIDNVAVNKISEKTKVLFDFIFVRKISERVKSLLDLIFNIIAVVLSVAMLFMGTVESDGVQTTIYCMCCGWLAGYFFSRTIKSFKIYRETKGK